MGQLSDWLIIVCKGLLLVSRVVWNIYQRDNLHLQLQFKSQTAHALLRSCPAYGRSTSCTAWQSDRWPALLCSSMATGWNHPGARGSGGSSDYHADRAGSSSHGHPDGYPARFQHLSAEDTGEGRVTITHMTNASPPEGKGRRGKRRGGGWHELMSLLCL